MRSKTTVGGPSLSACVVIALGGKKGALGGSRLEQSLKSVCVCVLRPCVALCCPGSRPVDSPTTLLAE